MTQAEQNKAIRELKDSRRKWLVQDHPEKDVLLAISGAHIGGIRENYKGQMERETQKAERS